MSPKKKCDCVIVGAGPAGSTLAYYLAKRGFVVLIIDKHRFPRDKSCAGGVPLRARALCEFSIDETVENRITQLAFTYRLENLHLVENTQPFAYTVRRDRFDHLLLKNAEAAGATVRAGEAPTAVELRKDCVVLTTSQNSYCSRILVGADGVRSKVAELAGFRVKRRAIFTLQTKVDGVAHSDMMRIDFGSFPYGYRWSFPSGSSTLVGVGGLKVSTDLDGHLREWLDYCAPGISTTRVERFAIPLGGILQRVAKERVCLIGDAGNMTHPLTGEGIYYAMTSAILAGLAVEESAQTGDFSFHNYQRLIREELYPEFRKWHFLAGLFYQFPRIGYECLIKRNQKLLNYFT